MKVDLSKYVNRHGGKARRLVWEIVWRIFATTTPRWMLQGWRRLLLRVFGAKIGKNVQVNGGARVWMPKLLEIGENSWVGDGANLYCVAPIKIGANAVASENSFICTAEHDITSPYFELKTAPITIGDMAWVGSRAIVLPGIVIGEGAVVAAGSVVTHDVEPWTVVAGNPARPIKKREIEDVDGKIKVLHVTQGLVRSEGGPSESVPRTAIAQMKAGMRVGIAYPDVGELSEAAKAAAAAGVRMIPFAANFGPLNPMKFSWDMMTGLKKVAKNYDIIQVHLNWVFPTWWSAFVAKRLGKKFIMMPRACFEPERLKISKWKKRVFGMIDRHYAKSATAIWATAPLEERGIKAYVPGARTAVFPIGIDAAMYTLRAMDEKRGTKTLLFMSRISEIKGMDMLAKAWGEVRPKGWRLVIAGPDDRGYRGKMEKVFEELCEKGTYEFRDAVYGDEKRRLLASADAFVLPTRNENWGIVIAEAMASALPVICTKGAPWECLATEKEGWWTDVSVEGVAGAIRELAALSDEELGAMGRRGRKWVEENLDWLAIGRRMKEDYERYMGMRGE